MTNNSNKQGRAPREFFTLGEHDLGSKHFRFQYDGRTYRILEQQGEAEEQVKMEETDAKAAYDAWNHIKRPERFGGM